MMAHQFCLNGNVFLSCTCGAFDILMKQSSDSTRTVVSAKSSREDTYSANETFTSLWACVHSMSLRGIIVVFAQVAAALGLEQARAAH
jgi:hypothetical protein